MQLRGRSRNSVIGRVHRLGLAADAPRMRRPPRPKHPKGPPVKRRHNMNIAMNGRLNKIDARRNPPAPKPVAENPNGANKILFSEMPTRGRCKYLLTDDNSFPKPEEMYVCGETTEAGSSWCAWHRDRVFYKQPYRDAAA